MTKTYTVEGERGNDTGPYTHPLPTLAAALDAVKTADFPLCPVGRGGMDASGTFSVKRALPRYICERTAQTVRGTNICGGGLLRRYDLRTGNVVQDLADVKQTWPGAYNGCPLTEDLVARPRVSADIPAEWIGYCREAGLIRHAGGAGW